jgi:hypothetical protein
MGIGGPFPGGKARSGRDAVQSPNIMPRSRMSSSYTSCPPYAFIGALWDCFAFSGLFNEMGGYLALCLVLSVLLVSFIYNKYAKDNSKRSHLFIYRSGTQLCERGTFTNRQTYTLRLMSLSIVSSYLSVLLSVALITVQLPSLSAGFPFLVPFARSNSV